MALLKDFLTEEQHEFLTNEEIQKTLTSTFKQDTYLNIPSRIAYTITAEGAGSRPRLLTIDNDDIRKRLMKDYIGNKKTVVEDYIDDDSIFEENVVRIGGKIRRLSELEITLMTGFDKEDYEKIKDAISPNQIRKQMGNSIVVPVMEEVIKQNIPNNNSYKVLELFGGVGSPRKALSNLNYDFEVVDYVEVDNHAVNSYNLLYNEDYVAQDITNWSKNMEIDIVFHGSPCQDFSIAGIGKGGDKNSGTRSSLMWETVRIVEETNPQYVVWENVKNVLSKKHRHNFDKYLYKMEALGYENHYKVLSAKDFGIPQRRERVFVVSKKI